MILMTTEIAIGIDIGGTNTAFGFVDEEGNCLYQGSVPTGQTESYESFFNDLSREIMQSLAGVAIAVALVPPLTAAGIGLGRADLLIFSQAWRAGILPKGYDFIHEFGRSLVRVDSKYHGTDEIRDLPLRPGVRIAMY